MRRHIGKESQSLHKKLRGKIEIRSRFVVRSPRDLSLVYTPGVAAVAEEIRRHSERVYDYTSKWNNVAIVTDGSRLLGLGNAGPEASLPVMEGKAILFKQFGGINAFPICLATQEKHDIIKTVEQIAAVFGAINIEDIESPKSLEIVEHLQEELDIPVFHDDQHGTAAVVLAALINALKVVEKDLAEARIVVVGAGAAGYGIVRLLHRAGAENMLALDSGGIISEEREEERTTKGGRRTKMNRYKREIAGITNTDNLTGSLVDAVDGADALICVSGRKNLVTRKMVGSMSMDPIVFALTNPEPEITPEEAGRGGARIIATGRSDYHNQVNNALIFPYVLRAALDARIPRIDNAMLVGVATKMAELVGDKKLGERWILPRMTDKRILPAVARALKPGKM